MKAPAFEFSSLYSSAADTESSAARASAGEKDVSRPLSAKNKRAPLSVAQNTDTDSAKPIAVSTPVTKNTKKNKTDKKKAEVNTETPQAEKSILCIGASDKRKKRNKSVSFVLDDVEVDAKKSKTSANVDSAETAEGKESQKIKKHKNKNKKNKRATSQEEIASENSEEPKKRTKKKKKRVNPEDIEENLENLSIGENASTLADLLDDMKVDKKKSKKKSESTPEEKDKIKSKKKKAVSLESSEDIQEMEKVKKIKKGKRPGRKERLTALVAPPEDGGIEGNSEEPVKEKVKWNKRKWNKDKRAGGGDSRDELRTSVVVENLPICLLLTYKKLLTDHFTKCGLIKRVGIAELYPTVEPRTVFTTTVQFYSEGAAEQALEEDNMEVNGCRMSVRMPLPATDTTVAVRCYGGCSPHLLSSVFAPCGRVRCIREIQKGRSSMPTAFVEFDGPAAVERALKVAGEARIGGKKVLVNRFEDRSTHKRIRADSEGNHDGKQDKEPESDQDSS